MAHALEGRGGGGGRDREEGGEGQRGETRLKNPRLMTLRDGLTVR